MLSALDASISCRQGTTTSRLLASIRTKFLFSLAFAVAVLAALSLYADAGKLASTLSEFQWGLLPAILALTLWNYGLRFLKWHFYLRQIGVRNLSAWESLIIFFAGLSMVVTPGKVGEWLKSYFLRERVGVPFFRSAPIIVAERLTDGLAMVLLASVGVALFGLGWQVVLLVLLAAASILMVAWTPALAEVAFSIIAHLPIVKHHVSHLREFYASAQVIFHPKNLLLGVFLGTLSWAGECVAYYLVLLGLGQPPSGELLVQATFILAVSSLGGSLFLMPGGLGIAEGGITGFSQFLLGLPREQAVTSALLIRLSTLWFGVAIGLVMLLVALRRFNAPLQAEESQQAPEATGSSG